MVEVELENTQLKTPFNQKLCFLQWLVPLGDIFRVPFVQNFSHFSTVEGKPLPTYAQPRFVIFHFIQFLKKIFSVVY